ncbi:MAG TPA: hypothetical protein DCO71_06225 [Gammaproteobacteria bacterium]|nr:hypothetical protein [Gammaproteobacteria bacterium]
MYDEAKAILAALQDSGISPGHKLVLQLSAHRDFIPAFWACLIGGIVPVPLAIPPTYSDESNSILRNLVDTWSFLGKPVILADQVTNRHIDQLFRKLGFREASVLAIDALQAAGDSGDAQVHHAEADELALLLFTSGSTGRPKGICFTHRNLIENVAASAAVNRVSAADVSLNWLHLDHVGALVRCCIRDVYAGNTQIHAATQLFLHDPLRWLEWIETHRVTFAWAPNFGLSLFNERLRASGPPNRDISSLRSIVSVAEPIVPRVAREFAANLEHYGVGPEKLHAAWGMSETCAAVVFSGNFLARLPSPHYPFVEVGRPVPGLSIRITDDGDHLLEEGKTGNVQISGKMVISQYYADEQASANAYSDDGWFRTGDLGYLKDGALTITGRKKDTIIINGRNIANHEIEAIVDSIPGVEKTFTAAIGLRDHGRDTDQLVVFFCPAVTPADVQKILLERILERVVKETGILPAYLVPVDCKSIPKSSAGKILRSRLRDSFVQGKFDAQVKQADLLLANENTFPSWFLKRSWHRKQAPVEEASAVAPGITVLFADALGLADAVQDRLEAAGHICLRVRPGDSFCEERAGEFTMDPGNEDHYQQFFTQLGSQPGTVRNIFHLWAYTPHGVPVETQTEQLDRWFLSLAFLAKAIDVQLQPEQAITVNVCASCAQSVLEMDELCCEKSLALGLVQTIPQEQPFLDWRHYDLEQRDTLQDADLIVHELSVTGHDREIAYRDGKRYAVVLEELASNTFSNDQQADLQIQAGGLYLITGGFGEIGLEIARQLVEAKDAKLLLVGRSHLPAESPSLASDGVSGSDAALARKLHCYHALKTACSFIEYRAVDICNEHVLLSTVEELESLWDTKLCGIFHLARVTDDTLIRDQTGNGLLDILTPKVQGTLSAGRLLEVRPDAFFVGFSSVSSTLGTYRMAAYSAANRFIDSFCEQQRNSKGRKTRSLAWSIWEEVGEERHYQMRDLSRKRGLFTLSTDKGIASMFAAMHCQETGVIIGLDPANRFIRQRMAGPPELTNQLQVSMTFDTSASAAIQPEPVRIQDRLGNTAVCQLADAESSRSEQGNFAEKLASISPEIVSYRAELETRLLIIWQDLLRIDYIEPQDNFFDLGGNSVTAAQFIVELARQADEHIELGTLFEHPVLGDLVNTIITRQTEVTQGSKPALCLTGQLSMLLESSRESLRLAVRRQFPQALEMFPVRRYIRPIRKLPMLAGYSQLGSACARIMGPLKELAGDGIEPLYNRLAIVEAIGDTLERLDHGHYPRSIEVLFREWFRSLLEGLGREDEYFCLENDPFLKDMAVCCEKMVPVGGAWTIETSGISLRILLGRRPGHLIKRTSFVMRQARALKPFYQIHMAPRFADRFNEQQRTASYLRIAEMLRENTEIRGLIGISWYLDPALKTISPELSYLQDVPENNGAGIFSLAPLQGACRGALSGSSRRTRLYQEGKYIPRNAFIIWPREALLKWSDTHR